MGGALGLPGACIEQYAIALGFALRNLLAGSGFCDACLTDLSMSGGEVREVIHVLDRRVFLEGRFRLRKLSASGFELTARCLRGGRILRERLNLRAGLLE